MAFVSGLPLVPVLTGDKVNKQRPCICMKKRSSGRSKKPKTVKGFAKSSDTQSGSNNVQSNVPPLPPPPPPPSSTGEGEVLLDAVTGEEGNATPHRAAVMNRNKLQDPTKELIAQVETRELAPVENIDELRLDWKLSYDELIELFQDARQEERLDVLVRANRHLISEALLYRFTSAILKAESEERMEEAKNMRELRRVLISYSWEIDIPFKKAVLRAEERLMNTLQSGNIGKEAKRRAGSNTLEVDAYWVVVYAAIAAWEEQGAANEQLKNVDMQKALAVVAASFQGKLEEMQSKCLRVVAECLNLNDQGKQAIVLDALNDEDVAQLGTFIEQIRLLPVNAYDGLRSRLQTILDFLISKRYGIQPKNLTPVRFTPRDIERDSKIVMIQSASKGGGLKWPKFPWDK